MAVTVTVIQTMERRKETRRGKKGDDRVSQWASLGAHFKVVPTLATANLCAHRDVSL